MENKNEQKEGYRGIYLERSGESSRNLTETLLDPPELPLDEQEKLLAYQFEAELYNQELDTGKLVSEIIRSHKKEDVIAPFFFAEAFLTSNIDLSSLGNPDFNSPEDVYTWLVAAIQQRTIDAGTLSELAKESRAYYEQHAAESLALDGTLSPELTDYMPLVIEPEPFADTATDIQAIRGYLLDQRKIYKEGDDRLESAKRAIVDIYLAKINDLIAADTPVAGYLYDQAKLLEDKETMVMAELAAPKGLREALNSETKTQSSVLKRLDYMRNGMAINENGAADVNSSKLDSVEQSNPSETAFSEEQKAILQKTMVIPEEMQHIFTSILSKANLLSTEDSKTWTKDRRNRASDNLFQVVINPTQSSFSVDSISGTYQIPSVSRSLYDVMTIGGFHELQHINQAQADMSLANVVKIAELKGRRVSGLREAGANIKQREAEEQFFGSSKPIALTYAKAIEKIKETGSIAEAAQGFYDEKLRLFPQGNKEQLAKEAAGRVLRLARAGISSQPLVYVEEGIMAAELKGAPAAVGERATTITALDLVDQLRLHKYGLLPTDQLERGIDWTELILETVSPYVNKALNR
jgi:hypothetical protein